MKNKRTAIMPYEPVYVSGDILSIDVEEAKRLILFTDSKDKLTGHNQFQLDPRIQTNYGVSVNDSARSFDSDVGTIRLLNDVTDNVWVSRVNNSDKFKTLPSGFLQANSGLTVDKTNHTITEECIIRNDNTANSATIIDDCSSAAGWTLAYGSNMSISSDGTKLTCSGTVDELFRLGIFKTFSVPLDSYKFICFKITANANCNLKCILYSGYNYSMWDNDNRFSLTANVEKTFVLPLYAPQGTTGANPNAVSTGLSSTLTKIIIGVQGTAVTSFSCKSFSFNMGKQTYLEIQTPDNLSPNSLTIQNYNGSTYQTTGVHSLDSSYSNVSQITTNSVFLDGTKLDDAYGTGLGRSIYPKGISNQTVIGSSGTITYSHTKGTKNRIGIRVDLPPSDDGRTNFNQIRLKLVISYTDVIGNFVTDESYNGRLGVITGNPIKSETGFTFTGSDKITMSAIPSNVFSNGITLIADVTLNNTSDLLTGIVSERNGWGVNQIPFCLEQYSNTIRFAFYNSTYLAAGVTTPSTGIKYRIVASYDKSRIRLAANGSLGTSVPYSLDICDPLSTLVIGCHANTANYFKGKISNIEILNVGLNDTELVNVSNGGKHNYVTVYKTSLNTNNMGSTTYEFSSDTNLGTGINLIKKPYFCFYDPSKYTVNYYVFTKKPLSGQYSYDQDGNIYNITFNLEPSTKVYKGQLNHVNLTADSNSDKIPNFVDSTEIVSVDQLIGHLDFVYNYITNVNLSPTIVANDFGLTLDNCPIIYSSPVGNHVYSGDTQLVPIGVTSTLDGKLNYFDVSKKSTIRIDEGQNSAVGDCKVFDTVTTGNTDESTWKRVYDANWVFTGAWVIENGLIRITSLGYTGAYAYAIYVYVNSTWVLSGYFQQYLTTLGGYEFCINSITINMLSTDIIDFNLNGYANLYPNITASFRSILSRGSYVFKSIDENSIISRFDLDNSSIRRFQIASNSVLWDTNYTRPYISGYFSTMFDPTIKYIQIIISPKSVGYSGSNSEITTNNDIVIRGAIPFDCSLLYSDASSMTGGDSI